MTNGITDMTHRAHHPNSVGQCQLQMDVRMLKITFTHIRIFYVTQSVFLRNYNQRFRLVSLADALRQ